MPQIELAPDTLEVCDDDFDGFGLFDLSLANEQLLNGLDPLEFEVTYYETPENAETATSPIATPFSYTNLNPTQSRSICSCREYHYGLLQYCSIAFTGQPTSHYCASHSLSFM